MKAGLIALGGAIWVTGCTPDGESRVSPKEARRAEVHAFAKQLVGVEATRFETINGLLKLDLTDPQRIEGFKTLQQAEIKGLEASISGIESKMSAQHPANRKQAEAMLHAVKIQKAKIESGRLSYMDPETRTSFEVDIHTGHITTRTPEK